MGHTFGDRFREYDLAAQRRLMRRFRAVAMTLCERHGFYDSEPDDLVQEAFKALVPKEYEFHVDAGPITLIWKIIERKIIDERRRRRPIFEHEIRPPAPNESDDEYIPVFDAADASSDAEQNVITRETLLTFISETEQSVARLESLLSVRRRDFRMRAQTLFDKFCSDPSKYVNPDGQGVRVSELAADLGWTENAYQQFKRRVDSVLNGAGLSLDRLFLGIFVHEEANRLGIAPEALQIEL